MVDSQPFPVKFYAAINLEKVLQNDIDRVTVKYLEPAFGTIFRCYLSLITQIENQDLENAFETVMSMFPDKLKPYAVSICEHLA